MGSRCVVEVAKNLIGKPLVTVYQQYDGYPSGIGYKLTEFLAYHEISNGLPSGPHNFLNGLGELASMIIWYMKAGISGNVYIEPPYETFVGTNIEYVYRFYVGEKPRFDTCMGSVYPILLDIYTSCDDGLKLFKKLNLTNGDKITREGQKISFGTSERDA